MKRIFIILILGIVSCTDPNAGQLTDAQKALVDSLYNRDIDSIRTYYDSLCNYQHDSIFNIAVDSILEVRLREIEQLRSIE
ncbi:MAG: hypothetical protein HKN68_07340 [Saprospiraceae bacterium]|nr:hypothetical protein [Saprospiraceae bacterium]